jgi:hypothetical protein
LRAIDPQSRYGRVAGIVDLDALARRRLAFIGLGSMGQPVSSQMGRHGVATSPPGRLSLIDGDFVSDRNLIGTEYRCTHLGLSKAEAAMSIVRESNPDVNVSYWHRTLGRQDMDEVVNLARQSDLLGLFADSFELMIEISDRCAAVCPQVMALFGPNADYAEVAFSIPGQTVPISQSIGRRHRQTIASPRALGSDTTYVASFVATLCLSLLLHDAQGAELLPCSANAPLFVAGLRKSWIFANQPGDVARSILYVEAR